MKYFLNQEEFDLARQTEHNLKILHNTVMNFKEQAKNKFICTQICEGCLFENSTFDGMACLAGFTLPVLQEDDNKPTE